MSMWLSYAKLSPAAFDKVRKTPSLVEALFFDTSVAPPADFDGTKDVFGEDYRTVSEVLEAMQEAGVEVGTLQQALGDGALGSTIDYDFCYGPGFAFDPGEVASLAAELGADPDGFGISEFFTAAAKEGKGIIGGVS